MGATRVSSAVSTLKRQFWTARQGIKATCWACSQLAPRGQLGIWCTPLHIPVCTTLFGSPSKNQDADGRRHQRAACGSASQAAQGPPPLNCCWPTGGARPWGWGSAWREVLVRIQGVPQWAALTDRWRHSGGGGCRQRCRRHRMPRSKFCLLTLRGCVSACPPAASPPTSDSCASASTSAAVIGERSTMTTVTLSRLPRSTAARVSTVAATRAALCRAAGRQRAQGGKGRSEHAAGR